MQNFVDQIHFPVMSGEVLSFLKINPKGIYCDGTIGLGGHAEKIIQNLSNEGQLIGIDRDENAISLCKKRFSSSKNAKYLYLMIHMLMQRYYFIESGLNK